MRARLATEPPDSQSDHIYADLCYFQGATVYEGGLMCPPNLVCFSLSNDISLLRLVSATRTQTLETADVKYQQHDRLCCCMHHVFSSRTVPTAMPPCHRVSAVTAACSVNNA